MSNPVYWFAFTWNCQDEQDEAKFAELYDDFICDLKENPRKLKFVFQLERGEETKRLHYQGFVHIQESDKKTRIETMRSELVNGKPERNGLFVSICSANGKSALERYCMKSETRVNGPWADRLIYMGQDLPSTLWPWQLEAKHILTGPMERRKIYWWWSMNGNNGKSIFAKYMKYYFDIPKITFGKCSDLLSLVAKQPNKKAYVFDLSRTKSRDIDMDEIYSAIENIKNGHFVNTKYEVEEILMLPPHIMVFANYPPDTSKLSSDRWIIRDLDNMVHITV